ncbi:MAG: hypothetical protein ACI9SP_000582 [Arenicella sp.]|jgi:hypothetical protein
MNLKKIVFISVILNICLFVLSKPISAHPEDEFCDQTVSDVLLCSELAELDRTGANFSQLPAIELDRSPVETLLLYVQLGLDHILPLGLDHLAFVLALILSASALRPLLIQISVFTMAHSITLVLGVLNIVVLNALWVEVAIALSIAFVAIENLFIKTRLAWRALVIFCFGLLHGLGFAGALSDLGIPNAHFISALVGFNIGVEIAQLLFGLVVFLLLHKLVKERHFKRFVFIPGNWIVAIAGIYWLVERLL